MRRLIVCRVRRPISECIQRCGAPLAQFLLECPQKRVSGSWDRIRAACRSTSTWLLRTGAARLSRCRGSSLLAPVGHPVLGVGRRCRSGRCPPRSALERVRRRWQRVRCPWPRGRRALGVQPQRLEGALRLMPEEGLSEKARAPSNPGVPARFAVAQAVVALRTRASMSRPHHSRQEPGSTREPRAKPWPSRSRSSVHGEELEEFRVGLDGLHRIGVANPGRLQHRGVL